MEGYGRERSSDGCRGPAALANKPGVAGVGPPPTVELVPTLPGPTNVVLVAVPFTAVLTGFERTPRDNAEAASTGAVLCLRR